jgi:hypothetical protein
VRERERKKGRERVESGMAGGRGKELVVVGGVCAGEVGGIRSKMELVV